MSSNTDLTFPPLFTGLGVEPTIEPFAKACAEAAIGCDSGLIVHSVSLDRLAAAVVFAPEVPLGDAMAMLPLCELGFQNALGALAPPEVAVHVGWLGEVFVNGARCGRFQCDASTYNDDSVPDWLVIGFELPLLPGETEREQGHNPNDTTLFEEGCADVDALRLLESWSRHTLTWLNRWNDEGNAPLHRDWSGILRDVGEDIEISLPMGNFAGTFVGLDDKFGMLLRDGSSTHLLPLSQLLTGAK